MPRSAPAIVLAVLACACTELPTQVERPLFEYAPPMFSLGGAAYQIDVVDIWAPEFAQYGTAFAVNDHGEVVVGVISKPDSWRLYKDGTWAPIPGLAAKPWVLPYDLSDAGLLVGQYEPTNYSTHAFVLDVRSGVFRDLGTLGLNAAASAVTENGIVVGRGAVDYTYEHGFIWRGAAHEVEILPNLDGFPRCQAWDANSSGVVVGVCVGGSSNLVAVAWVDGEPMPLQGLGGYDTRALAVNERGWIAGTGTDPGFRNRAVFWSSVDAPATQMGDMIVNSVVGMSDDGWIAGYGQPFNYNLESFLIIDGNVNWLPSLFGNSTSVWDLSDEGIPVGRSWAPPWGTHPTLWTVQKTVPDASPADIVDNLVADIGRLVSEGALSSGNGNALVSTLDAASAALDRGSTGAAANQIGAFINQVEAMVRSGRLLAGTGQALIDAAGLALAGI